VAAADRRYAATCYREVLNRARWDALDALAVMLPVPFAVQRWARLAKVPAAQRGASIVRRFGTFMCRERNARVDPSRGGAGARRRGGSASTISSSDVPNPERVKWDGLL
jgi:hypothetical protein